MLGVAGNAGNAGVRALVAHALSEKAKVLYEHYGFQESDFDPMTLTMRLPPSTAGCLPLLKSARSPGTGALAEFPTRSGVRALFLGD